MSESRADRQRRIMAEESVRIRHAWECCRVEAANLDADVDRLFLAYLARREDDLGCRQAEVTNALAELIKTIESKRGAS